MKQPARVRSDVGEITAPLLVWSGGLIGTTQLVASRRVKLVMTGPPVIELGG